MIKAVIFDCYGVLVGAGFDQTYRLAGGDPASSRQFIDESLAKANLGSISDAEFHNSMAEHLSISKDKWLDCVIKSNQANLDLLEFIKSLKKDYKTAILSNANKGVIETEISPDLLRKCFDEIIISADVGYVKPDPKIYLLAADKLGVDPKNCLFVDDKSLFTDAAKNVGMKAIHFKDNEQFKKEFNNYLT